MHKLTIICVAAAVILWAFIAVLFVGVTIYNKISGRHLSFRKADIKAQEDNTGNKDRADLFL